MRKFRFLISLSVLLVLVAFSLKFYLSGYVAGDIDSNSTRESKASIDLHSTATPTKKKSRHRPSNVPDESNPEVWPTSEFSNQLISKPFEYNKGSESISTIQAPNQPPAYPTSVRTPKNIPESSVQGTGTAPNDPIQGLITDLRNAGTGSQNGDGSYIGGVRVSGGSNILPPTAIPLPTESNLTPTPVPKLERVGGQARGYAMLYLMHPSARQTVEKQVDTLLRAEVNEIYLGVLTDGTFSLDIGYLNSIIRRLNSEGRVLTLVLYLTNGPSMRTYETLPIDAGFNAIDPLQFRELIRFSLSIRNRFINMASQLKPVFDLNLTLNPLNKNIAVVMLEDNLEVNSYRAMRDLAHSVLGNGVDLFRNPCPSCFEGNDTETLGDGIELHAPSDMSELQSAPKGGYTLDGFGYRFSGETNPLSLDLDSVFDLELESINRGAIFFGLWRAERQGIYGGTIHPNEREYEIPTEEQQQIEIEILRYGLNPL